MKLLSIVLSPGLIFFGTESVAHAQEIRINDLRIEYMEDPLGMEFVRLLGDRAAISRELKALN